MIAPTYDDWKTTPPEEEGEEGEYRDVPLGRSGDAPGVRRTIQRTTGRPFGEPSTT